MGPSSAGKTALMTLNDTCRQAQPESASTAKICTPLRRAPRLDRLRCRRRHHCPSCGVRSRALARETVCPITRTTKSIAASTALAQLGLEQVAHLQISKPGTDHPGGQRKRVNIAMELVTDPVIMFLDEPTSGLAADDTQALVQLLADLSKQTGKTIITTIPPAFARRIPEVQPDAGARPRRIDDLRRLPRRLQVLDAFKERLNNTTTKPIRATCSTC